MQLLEIGTWLKDQATIVIPAIVTAVISYFAGRKKEQLDLAKATAEKEANEIENVEKAITIWRKLAEDMAAQVSELKAQVNALTEQVGKLTVENQMLTQEIKSLKK